MLTHKDQLGRLINLSSIPQRIVSLVPSQTELLIALGLRDWLVGITKYCIHPVELLAEKTIVGGTKQVKLELIESLEPDLILCNKEENRQEAVAALEKIAPVHVSDVEDMDDAIEMIGQYGHLFDCTDRADFIIDQIQSAHDSFEQVIKHIPKRRVAYLIWRNPWMVVGNNTFIDYLLKLNHFDNVFSNGFESRYPEIDASALNNVDYVLLSSEPFPFSQKHIEELQHYTDAKIIFVDGEYFSWYGDRLVAAFDYFAELQAKLAV
ncbi:MAG: ABC transporter substrate-binding protein [Thiotrichales bacterium]|nr:ABC transporter substrate-binding protein [Thiotrichales bacterium]